jgi:hypothetical protein
LAKIPGLDPKTDLAGANLNQVNLSGGNLRGANLRSTNLSGANLTGTDLSGADLRDADLRNANLRGANLSRVDLRDANVENAIFRNNEGIFDTMKLDLIQRGAVFENSLQMSEYEDINIIAYNDLMSDSRWRKDNQGKYVAVVEGKIVGITQDKQELLELLNNPKYRNKERLIRQVGDENRTIDAGLN